MPCQCTGVHDRTDPTCRMLLLSVQAGSATAEMVRLKEAYEVELGKRKDAQAAGGAQFAMVTYAERCGRDGHECPGKEMGPCSPGSSWLGRQVL